MGADCRYSHTMKTANAVTVVTRKQDHELIAYSLLF